MHVLIAPALRWFGRRAETRTRVQRRWADEHPRLRQGSGGGFWESRIASDFGKWQVRLIVVRLSSVPPLASLLEVFGDVFSMCVRFSQHTVDSCTHQKSGACVEQVTNLCS